MTPPEGVYFARARSGMGLFLLVLLSIGAATGWLWSERREKSAGGPRPIAVAQADSSGVMSVPESLSPLVSDTGRPQLPPQVTPEGFIAPAPSFQNPSEKPIGDFLDYARQMQFDPARGQNLQLPKDTFGREPVIHLEPLANLRRLDSLALAQGRILARIRSDVAVSPLGLRSGDNFLWVRGTLGGTIPGELWTSSALASARQVTLSYAPRAPAEIPAGKDAWWVGDEVNGRQLWIVCGHGWCHT